jgi:hypothetical protein
VRNWQDDKHILNDSFMTNDHFLIVLHFLQLNCDSFKGDIKLELRESDVLPCEQYSLGEMARTKMKYKN